jgi:hypothetical protein
MHRAGPGDQPPYPHRRYRRPDGASVLLEPPPDRGPRDLTPRRARVTIREIPQPPRRDWAGWWRRHWVDVIALAVIALAVTAAIRFGVSVRKLSPAANEYLLSWL